MKFLVHTWPAPNPSGVLPAAADFADRIAWVRSRLADGTLLIAGHGDAIDGHNSRAVFVFETETREAVDRLLDEMPLGALMSREIEPLAEFFAHSEGVLHFLKSAET